MSGICTPSAHIIQRYMPESYPRRILLFNPPLYDIRFPWSQWEQPVTLLQLATLFRRYQCDLRFIDAFGVRNDVKRRRIRTLTRDGNSINYWRLGIPSSELTTQLRNLHKEGWQPEEVYVEGSTTFRWEGAVEAITLVRKRFPHAKIVLYGAYPSLATEHALRHSEADILITGTIEGLAGLPLDLSLYSRRSSFTYLSVGTPARSSSDLVEEFLAKALPKDTKESIRQFVFADHDVVKHFPEQFQAVLQTAIHREIKVSFYALGNIHPSDIADNPELASLLFRSGFKQLVFADDRDVPLTREAREHLLDQYDQAIAYCIAAGYQRHTEVLVGTACIGRPGEDIEETTTFVTKLAHVAGALMVIPYQPFPAECLDLPLEQQNGKLFPFAEQNGVSYRTYQDLLGLAAVLNAKYRSHTFDFLGDSIISQLVRSSLISKSWNPHNRHDLPKEHPVIIGWFNKEGKWVRS